MLNATKSNIISIQAQSAGFLAGNFAKITINHVPIDINKNENGNSRGLHVIVINPLNDKVESASIFDTYARPDGFDGFIRNKIPDGYIVVAACQDECSNKMSKAAKEWFANMGSKEIWNLSYR